MKPETGLKDVNAIRIELDRRKCIGNGICAEIDQYQRFLLKGGKAELMGGELIGDMWVSHINCGKEDAYQIVSAGKACPVNAIKVVNEEDNSELVSVELKKANVKVIRARYDDLKEFVMDAKGYFLIRIDKEKKQIEVAFCPEVNKMTAMVVGKKPIEIYQTIIKEGLISRFDHAAYLGRELQKAYIALQENIVYVQDDELDFSKHL